MLRHFSPKSFSDSSYITNLQLQFSKNQTFKVKTLHADVMLADEPTPPPFRKNLHMFICSGCHYMKNERSWTSECWEGNEHTVEQLFRGGLSHLPPPWCCDVISHMSERAALCDEEEDEDEDARMLLLFMTWNGLAVYQTSRFLIFFQNIF